jgi:ATP-dependent DNA helicase RecG
LINALAHRDWTRPSDVEIAGYLDRMEITSPGALPNSMTVEKVMAGQRSARNNIIVDVLRDYGYVDARGMGVRVKVIPALVAREAKYAYEATEDYVKVIIGKTSGKNQECRGNVINVGKDADKRRETAKTSVKILEACRERNTITISDLAVLIGKSERSIERNIQKLQQDGLLKRSGGRKGGHWEVGGSGVTHN